LRISAITTNTAAAGLGTGIVFSAERPSGEINLSRAAIYGVSQSENESGYLSFYTRTNTGPGDFTEKMRLDASGNLGVGTTSPTQTLDVAGSSVFGTHNGTNFLNIERYASGVPYAIVRAGSTDQNVPVGLMIQARDTNGSAFDHTLFDASGNLGVGTATGDPFSLGSGGKTIAMDCTTAATGTLISMASANTARGYLYANNTEFRVSAYASIPLIFRTADTERARITSGGYLKASDAGTYLNAAGAYHELRQTANDSGVIVTGINASLTNDVLQVRATRNTTNNTFFAINYFNDGAAAYRFRVADSGNVTNTNNSYGAISDEKVKQDIVDAASQWADIKGLRVRKFRYKNAPRPTPRPRRAPRHGRQARKRCRSSPAFC
jgi:hypothetical protein